MENYELVVENNGGHQFIHDAVRVVCHLPVSNAIVYVVLSNAFELERLRTLLTERELTFTLNRMDSKHGNGN